VRGTHLFNREIQMRLCEIAKKRPCGNPAAVGREDCRRASSQSPKILCRADGRLMRDLVNAKRRRHHRADGRAFEAPLDAPPISTRGGEGKKSASTRALSAGSGDAPSPKRYNAGLCRDLQCRPMQLYLLTRPGSLGTHQFDLSPSRAEGGATALRQRHREY